MKKIIVSEDMLSINNQEIKWEDIKGLREQSSSFLHQFGTRFPRAELFTSSGKVFVIPNKFVLEGCKKIDFKDKYKDQYAEFFTLINLLSKKVQISPTISGWIEWRLLVPVLVTEFILGFLSLAFGAKLNEAIVILVVGGIISLPIGWFWEHSARKKAWNVK